MNMGSKGIINITPDMMNNAIKVIDEYRETTTDLHTELSNTVSNLIPGSFSGSAASGFQAFYTVKIETAIGNTLTDLIDSLRQIMEETLKAIPGEDQGVDEELGKGNRQ